MHLLLLPVPPAPVPRSNKTPPPHTLHSPARNPPRSPHASKPPAASRSGLRRPAATLPQNRVTHRSKLPQKKCTGLIFPRNPVANRLNTVSAYSSTRWNRCTDSGSYARMLRHPDRTGSASPSRRACGSICTFNPQRRQRLLIFREKVRHRLRPAAASRYARRLIRN